MVNKMFPGLIYLESFSEKLFIGTKATFGTVFLQRLDIIHVTKENYFRNIFRKLIKIPLKFSLNYRRSLSENFRK